MKEMWKLNCLQLSQFDTSLAEKEEEIAQLKEQLVVAGSSVSPPSTSAMAVDSVPVGTGTGSMHLRRKGKAPPVDPFTGENPDVMLDDWFSKSQSC